MEAKASSVDGSQTVFSEAAEIEDSRNNHLWDLLDGRSYYWHVWRRELAWKHTADVRLGEISNAWWHNERVAPPL